MNPPRIIAILAFLVGAPLCFALDITTRSGVTYKNCKILEAQPDRLRIMHSGGVTSVELEDLPDSLQKRYHYNAEKAAASKGERATAEKRDIDRAAADRGAGSTSVDNTTKRSESDAGSRAFDAIRVGNLDEAHRWLIAAIRADPRRDLYSEIDDHIRTLARSLNNHRFAQQHLQRICPELERIRRNASIADRPNILIPNDDSNQVRAREMRAQAEQMQQDAQQQLEEAQKQIEGELRLLDTVASKQKTAGAYSVALDLTEMIENVAAHYLSRRSFSPSIEKGDQTMLRRRVGAASKELLIARAYTEANKLSAAQQAVDRGLHEEPGRYELELLSDQLRKTLNECGKIASEALALKDKKQFEQSLEKVQAAKTWCIDHPDIERLSAELLATISEREKRLAKANVDEKAGDFDSALRTYDTYGLDDDTKRVIPKLAKLREDRGDFMAAYSLYEKANMSAEMQRIRTLRDEQRGEYQRAKALLAQGKFDDAVAIFEKYKDLSAKRDAMLQKAAFLEGEEKFEDAIQAYSAADASFEIARVRTFVSERQKLVADASNLERAANFDAALDLFRKANAKRDVERVAGAIARDFEKKQDFESAAQYFEIAGLYEEAGRIRKLHDLTKASSKRILSGAELFKRAAPACVTIVSGTDKGVGLGSGFFVAKNGYVLTNHHVIEDAREIKILTSTNKVLDVKLIRGSKTPDLALLQASITSNPILELGDSDTVETGAHVSAIGSPKSLPQSFTAGNISSTDRQMFGNKCFQISVLINHGNSGGPLLDDTGHVVGVNTFGEGTLVVDRASGRGIGSDIQGINYAIKINEAKALLKEINR